MREFVGVKSPLDVILEALSKRVTVESIFKREALMFNRIACPQVGAVLSSLQSLRGLGHPVSDQLSDHLSYLYEKGLLFELPPSAEGGHLNLLEADSEYLNLKSIERPIEQTLIDSIHKAGLDEFIGANNQIPISVMESYLPKVETVIAPIYFALQYLVRRISVEQRILNGIDAYPIFSEIIPSIALPGGAKSVVINLVIKILPLPNDNVPWEQIVEYRTDPDSQMKFLALRHWMSEVARAALTPAEIEEKLEYLIDQYQRHMKFHRMKTNTGMLETVVVSSAEVLGNLVSFKWGKVAQALFSLKHSREALLEGELTSPGSEVAYIVKAQDRFNVGS